MKIGAKRKLGRNLEPYVWLLPSVIMMGVMILVPIISLLSKKTAPAEVEKMFSCYRQVATVDMKDSLGK